MKTTELRAARIVGFFSIPSISLAECNPTAYANAMRDIPSNAGVCAHCGMSIIHHVIIETTNGNRAFVGTTCAEKVGCDPIQVRYRRTDADIQAYKEKKEQQRIEREHRVQDNLNKVEMYRIERLEKDAEIAHQIVETIGKELLDFVISKGENYWGASYVAECLINGDLNNPSGYRINSIDVERFADGTGKLFGRRNSKNYNEVYNRIHDAFNDEILEDIAVISAWFKG